MIWENTSVEYVIWVNSSMYDAKQPTTFSFLAKRQFRVFAGKTTKRDKWNQAAVWNVFSQVVSARKSKMVNKSIRWTQVMYSKVVVTNNFFFFWILADVFSLFKTESPLLEVISIFNMQFKTDFIGKILNTGWMPTQAKTNIKKVHRKLFTS